MTTDIPLTDLSIPQIDKILEKLHLKAPRDYNADDRIELLWHSTVFRRQLNEYENADIQARFDRKGNFVDFQTVDEVVSGIFPSRYLEKVHYYIPVSFVVVKLQTIETKLLSVFTAVDVKISSTTVVQRTQYLLHCMMR